MAGIRPGMYGTTLAEGADNNKDLTCLVKVDSDYTWSVSFRVREWAKGNGVVSKVFDALAKAVRYYDELEG